MNQEMKCCRCSRAVYPVDRIGPLKNLSHVFHRHCFKCSVCGRYVQLCWLYLSLIQIETEASNKWVDTVRSKWATRDLVNILFVRCLCLIANVHTLMVWTGRSDIKYQTGYLNLRNDNRNWSGHGSDGTLQKRVMIAVLSYSSLLSTSSSKLIPRRKPIFQKYSEVFVLLEIGLWERRKFVLIYNKHFCFFWITSRKGSMLKTGASGIKFCV